MRNHQFEIPEQAASLHMREVILWTNGNCMVFDDKGQQMCEFQGIFENAAPRINAVFSGNWQYGDWRRGIIQSVPFEQVMFTENGVYRWTSEP